MNVSALSLARALCCLGLALVLGLQPAQAQQPVEPPHAVLSLVGDKISIVGHVSSTGSHIDTNKLLELDASTDELERAALFAAEDAIKKARPGARAQLLAVRDARLYAAQAELFGSAAQQKAYLGSLKALLGSQAPARLLLITKYRAPARLELRDGSIGNGYLHGLGFYVDRITNVEEPDTGVSGRGYLAPFAYVRASLVDLDGLTVLRHSYATASRVIPVTRAKDSTHPWDALDAVEKVNHLKHFARIAVERAVPDAMVAQ